MLVTTDALVIEDSSATEGFILRTHAARFMQYCRETWGEEKAPQVTTASSQLHWMTKTMIVMMTTLSLDARKETSLICTLGKLTILKSILTV